MLSDLMKHKSLFLSKQNIYELGQVLLIDKPYDWTSFDVVLKLRQAMKIKKVGHAGTLDPLATGLLILCTGSYTKRINEYVSREKEYSGTLVLGAVTPTYDLESEPIPMKSFHGVTNEQIVEASNHFTGELNQVPPSHSAVKLGGRRVYELARKGVEVNLAPRKIIIRNFVIEKISLPEIQFRVVCSTGTYIRSLANDFGVFLGCGGYLSSLCRTRIGEFKLEDALTIEAAIEQIKKNLSFG